MAENTKPKHSNIYAALAAFQAEAPEIKKTKQFGKEGDKMFFKYASLDDILEVALPITAKHGLSVTWDGEGENLHCVLYHETYEVELKEVKTKREFDGTVEETTDYKEVEKNVIRSLPIGVARKGDMKTIGNNSTYARRYTVCEVLGLAAEEDKDIGRVEALENAVMTRNKQNIDNAKDIPAVEKLVEYYKKELALLKAKKKTAFGLTEPQYNELITHGEKKIESLGGEATINADEEEAPAEESKE